MSLVVGTNVSALYSQNALKTNARTTATTMERLSTGVRVNNAKDDAAGLAIGQNMTSQIRGLDQAVRNINDGINLVQTAEGGLNSISNMLQRMRELAVQAANGTNSDVQRGYLNKECEQLQTAIGQVVDTTMWNDQKLLDGSFAKPIQIGSDVGTKMNITIPSAKTTNIFPPSSTPPAGVFINPSNGHSYELVTTQQTISWANAKVAAETKTLNGEHGYLATVTSAAENQFIVDKFGSFTGWIGASDAAQEGTWKWVTGPEAGTIFQVGNASNVTSTPSYTNFDGGEPSGTNGESYAGFHGGNGWNDFPNNSYEVNEYIVEYSTVPTNIDISTASNAVNALPVLDAAIDAVNNTRATLGSYINRLAYAADNVTNISSNATQSRSTIIDTDYAIETTNLAKNQIIQQAATAMLAQSNTQPQAVMALLKNA
jgi:flagellin